VYSFETLRGIDRELAEVLVEAGYKVGVRACVAPIPNYDPIPSVGRGTFPPMENVLLLAAKAKKPAAKPTKRASKK